LIVLLPLTWWLMRTERALWVRVAAAACAALILGGVLLTYSRGAFVGLVAMLVLMGFLRVVTARQVISAGVLVLVTVLALSPGYLDRMGTLRGIEGLADPAANAGAGVEPVARERGTIMLAAWNVFLDHPILGVGPGQFAGGYIMQYVAELYSMGAIDRPYATHSLYLQLAAETGCIGLSVFMLIVIVALSRLSLARQHAEDEKFVGEGAAALMVAIVVYMVTGLFLHLAYQRYFWMLVGLGGAVVQLFEQRNPGGMRGGHGGA